MGGENASEINKRVSISHLVSWLKATKRSQGVVPPMGYSSREIKALVKPERHHKVSLNRGIPWQRLSPLRLTKRGVNMKGNILMVKRKLSLHEDNGL